MTEKTVEYKIKICEECKEQMVPSLYPGGDFTEPENGISYITSTIPAWVCSNCGFHSLVLKEENSDWLFANIRWQRSLVVGVNIAHELAEGHGMGEGHECTGCGDCDESDSDKSTPGKTLAAIFDEAEEEADSDEASDERLLH